MATPQWSEDDEEQHGPRPFKRFELGVMLRDGGPPPPSMICGGMLYPGCVHSISGPPESGKTTLAFWWAVQILRDGGTVAVLDEEGGPELTAARLVALGLEEAEAERLLYYPFESRAWTDPDIVAWHELMADEKPDMVIIDSVAVSMGNAGLDENVGKDTVRFFGRVVLPCARKFGAAILLIDHDAKNDNGSRYAAGSKSKLGTIDVQFKVTAQQRFSRAESGALRLEVTKDRPGWIHPTLYRLEVSSHLDIWFASDAEALAAEAAAKAEKLTPSAQKVLACLSDNRAGIKRIGDRVAAAYGMNFKRETISRALSDLQSAGLAVNLHPGGAGTGDESLWVLAQYAKKALAGEPPPAEGTLPMDRPNG